MLRPNLFQLGRSQGIRYGSQSASSSAIGGAENQMNLGEFFSSISSAGSARSWDSIYSQRHSPAAKDSSMRGRLSFGLSNCCDDLVDRALVECVR